MRYHKGCPLNIDTPFSRLVGDVLMMFIGSIGLPLFRALYRISFEKANNEARHGALPKRAILLCNHCMPLDPIFYGIAIVPRRTYFTVLEETCEAPVIGSLVRLLGGIPLPRSSSRLQDIEDAVAHGLATRGLVLFFPEGECFLGNQSIYPFKAGACYFAIRLGVPVVPIVTILTRRNGRKSKQIRVRVRVLPPLAPPAPGENSHATLLRAIRFSNNVRRIMQAEIERAGGDKSLYRGPMPRVKGVNDKVAK